MKLNKKNRWSSLLALVAAGIIIEASPMAFAFTNTWSTDQQNAVWTDLGVTVTKVLAAKTKAPTPAVVQAAIKAAVANYPSLTGSAVATGLTNRNEYSQAVVQTVLSAAWDSTAAAKYVQYAVTGALVGLTSSVDNTSGSFGSVISAGSAVSTLTDKQLAGIATGVTSGLVAPANAQVPYLANALAMAMTVDKDRAALSKSLVALSTVSFPINLVSLATQIAKPTTDNANLATIAKNIATAAPSLTPSISLAVAQTRTSSPSNITLEALIVKTVGKIASDPAALITTMETYSLSELPNGSYTQDAAGYNTKATDYATVAANYSLALSKQAPLAAGFAASQTVSTVVDATPVGVGAKGTGGLNGNGTTGADYASVAKTFGTILSKANVISPVTLAVKTSGTTVAQGIGNQLEGLITARGGSLSTDNGYNLTEVFAAVGLGLTHPLTVAKQTDANITSIVCALVTIEPMCAPDLLGVILTDMNATKALTYKGSSGAATSIAGKLEAAMAAAVTASPNTNKGAALTQLSYVLSSLFTTTGPVTSKSVYTFTAGNSTGTVAGNPYKTFIGITGQETPINNL